MRYEKLQKGRYSGISILMKSLRILVISTTRVSSTKDYEAILNTTTTNFICQKET